MLIWNPAHAALLPAIAPSPGTRLPPRPPPEASQAALTRPFCLCRIHPCWIHLCAVAADLFQLLILLAALLHSFAAALYFLSSHHLSSDVEECAVISAELGGIYWGLLLAPLGGGVGIACLEASSQLSIPRAVLLTYQTFAVILFLNTLIARLTKTFDGVWETQGQNYHLSFAKLVLAIKLQPVFRLACVAATRTRPVQVASAPS